MVKKEELYVVHAKVFLRSQRLCGKLAVVKLRIKAVLRQQLVMCALTGRAPPNTQKPPKGALRQYPRVAGLGRPDINRTKIAKISKDASRLSFFRKAG